MGSRAEANEAAAVFEVLGELKLIEQPRIDAQLDRLWRMLASVRLPKGSD